MHSRVDGFFEVTIPVYFLVKFENHLRMTRETCELLLFPCIHVNSGSAERLHPTSVADGTHTIIPEIPSKRAHSKRFPNFSKTYPGAFPVPFDFRPEISKILVKWKAPLVALTLKISNTWRDHRLRSWMRKQFDIRGNSITWDIHSN